MIHSKKSINYQKAILDIVNSMSRLKRPERLLKIITRYIDRHFSSSHTSFLILEEKRKRFIFVDSKGSRRFPMGLLRLDSDHPLVGWFERKSKKGKHDDDYLYRSSLNMMMKANPAQSDHLKRISKFMADFKVDLIVPGFFKGKLLGLLLLGKKKSARFFRSDEISFFQILAQNCSMAFKSAEYHRHLSERNQELEKQIRETERLRKKEHKTYYEIMRCLAQEVHAKDAYTFGHVSQVERLGMMTAEELKLDLSGRKKDILSAGLILHDVGKIGIPDHILKKESSLNDDEWEVMKTHAEKGAKILEPLTDFREVANIVLSHHEFYDGNGYPRGLKGEAIPIEARIVSVVDAFHAIVSTRCYSKGQPVEKALGELERCSGKQFDPKVVLAFTRALKKADEKAWGRGLYGSLGKGADISLN